MGLNVGKEIADLKQMTVRELREKYEAVFGEPTRAGNRDWLWKRIAWRMQANAEGGLTERARRRAEELANDADVRVRRPPDKPAQSPARRLSLRLCVDGQPPLYHLRREVERYFGQLTCFGGGLGPLPAWVRRLPRVQRWVTAKLIIYHARLQTRTNAA